MSVDTSNVSILHWVSSDKHKCGYCGAKNSITNGLWAECLTVEDYQNMIDRGWRRSGKYCYKPIMHETCCPQYTIRCAALNFKPSKSQKKVLKKFNKYLREGTSPTSAPETINSDTIADCDGMQDFVMPQCVKEIGNQIKLGISSILTNPAVESSISQSTSLVNNLTKSNSTASPKKEVKKGVGADVSLPKCQKAKFLRQKRREAKLLQAGQPQPTPVQQNKEKSLTDLINEQSMDNLHNIQVKLIQLEGAEWKQYRKIEFELYRKYQVCVHKDPPEKCTQKSFENFLADSPLQSSNKTFGSFHQQYWLDDKLIAVGVIDILPRCVSSVYFFYDPDYNHLTLGTYSALREVEFTQRLHLKQPSIEYYYMGFYIHTCIKMRYKGKFFPSDLLCPETYAWTPIDQCLPLLEVSKYSRLQKPGVRDDNNCLPGPLLDEMKIVIDYTVYKARQLRDKRDLGESIKLLGELLGKKLIASVYIAF